MKVLGFRFCTVSPEAPKLASFLDALGFERHPLEGGGDAGAVFAAGESWLAMWPPSADMPSGMMLQVVVDDADAFAERAREQGLSPQGPTDSQNKRIYFLQAPTGLQMSIQSRLPDQREQSVPAPPLAAPERGAAPERARTFPAPPPAPRGVQSLVPPARTRSSAPPAAAPTAAAPRTLQTVTLPPAASTRSKSAPPPPAPGRPRSPALGASAQGRGWSPAGAPPGQGRGWSPAAAPPAQRARSLTTPPPPPPAAARRAPR